jgi:hypothetical protein
MELEQFLESLSQQLSSAEKRGVPLTTATLIDLVVKAQEEKGPDRYIPKTLYNWEIPPKLLELQQIQARISALHTEELRDIERQVAEKEAALAWAAPQVSLEGNARKNCERVVLELKKKRDSFHGSGELSGYDTSK